MKIQLITGSNNIESTESITVTDYSNPMSPDDFDVNIMDLSYTGLWRSKNTMAGFLDSRQDLISYSRMADDIKNSRLVYVFPQDDIYQYHYHNGGYFKKMRIKDLITNVAFDQDYCKCFPSYDSHIDVVFERTNTKISSLDYKSSFRFAHDYINAITKSETSNKPTSIMTDKGNVYTTLDICSSTEKLMTFVKVVFADDPLSDIPNWVSDYEFGSDADSKKIIESSEKQIAELKHKIDKAKEELSINNRYKSILISNSDPLVEVVFEMLEKLLDCDLSEFVDERKEDFLIEKQNVVFIGEIKGISSNVKNENVSQLEVHYQSYMDILEEKQQMKNAKAILIINSQRNKKLEERKPVNERQIELAKRNGSLIIETITLLKMFDLHLSGKLSSEKCQSILEKKTGILTTDDF